MKALKLVLIFVVAIVLLAVLGFGVYLAVNKQKPAQPFEAIYGTGEGRILIATQGSKFKDLLTEELLSRLEGGNVYICGIDISGLAETDPAKWDAVLLVHTTEKRVLPPSVEAFLARAESDKIVEVITSGDGKWRPEASEVEIITSASKIERVSAVADEAVQKVLAILSAKVSPPAAPDSAAPSEAE